MFLIDDAANHAADFGGKRFFQHVARPSAEQIWFMRGASVEFATLASSVDLVWIPERQVDVSGTVGGAQAKEEGEHEDQGCSHGENTFIGRYGNAEDTSASNTADDGWETESDSKDIPGLAILLISNRRTWDVPYSPTIAHQSHRRYSTSAETSGTSCEEQYEQSLTRTIESTGSRPNSVQDARLTIHDTGWRRSFICVAV
ncbi:hypothetical protein LTR12_014852 [Friedmanniomyces endolithicus]|nr:hypothetical protein LTR12_014852 [Friedmanniomyces endolithicus]